MIDRLKNGDEHDRSLRSHMTFFAYTEQLEGPAGRVKIKDQLRKLTGIPENGRVQIAGQGPYISIWEVGKFTAKFDDKSVDNIFSEEDYQRL